MVTGAILCHLFCTYFSKEKVSWNKQSNIGKFLFDSESDRKCEVEAKCPQPV